MKNILEFREVLDFRARKSISGLGVLNRESGMENIVHVNPLRALGRVVAKGGEGLKFKGRMDF